MTVSTQVSRNEYTGNGSTTQYDFTFRILDKSHLLVQTLDTSESIVTLTLGTDYSVTGVNRYSGGKVVLNTPLPDGYKISIERSIPVTQETSIRNQGGFFPEIHEDAFDKLTMIIQRMYGWWSGLALKKPSWLANYYDAVNNRIRNLRDPSQAQDAATKSYVDNSDIDLQQQITSNLNRSLRVPDSFISQLPPADDRAWKGLGFDGAGQPKLQDPAGTGLWGYVPAIGSFEKGSLLTQRFEVLLWESTDEYWRWDGAMPKIVLPGSTPVTAGGTGKGKWIDVTDATLRSNLGSNELPGLSLVALAVSGNLSHAITGVYVDAFEADPTGGTDSTDAVIRAAKTLATMTTSGYDKNNKNYNVVIFGPGTYIVGDVPMFTGIRYVGQGPYATRIQPAEGCAYAFTTIGTTNVNQGTSSADRLFHSGVANMSIGSGYQTTDAASSNYTAPALNAGGILVKNASYMIFENLSIRFVDGCGLDCVELFDSDIKNVQLMSVGNDRDLDNIVPALRLMPDGNYSSTNAVRIDAMHIEECPKHMHIGSRTRHVFFTGGCKFEGGATTHSSTISGVNGVTFDSPELTWQRSDIPMFEMASVTAGISSNYGLTFEAPSCMSAPGTKGYYFHYTSDIAPLQINNLFARDAAMIALGSRINVLGGSAFRCGGKLFELYGDSTVESFDAINITPTSAGNSISLSSTGNIVRNCKLHSNGSLTDNTAAIAVGATATDAIVEGNSFGGTRNYAINLGNTTADSLIRNNQQISGASFGTFIKNSQPRRSFTQAKGKAGITAGTISISSGAEGWSSIAGQGALLVLHCVGSDGAARTAVILASYELNVINLIAQSGTMFKTDTTGAVAGNGFVYLTKVANSDQLRITNYSSLTLTLNLAGLNSALTS